MKKHLFFVLMLTACIQFYAGSLFAQSTPTDTTQLQRFKGKYQLTENNMLFLQILLQDGHLLLRQLWDKREIPFKQTSELEFYNDEHQFPLKFTKSSNGQITQVLAFNKDLWNRVADDYMPPMKKTIQLTGQQLKAYDGRYQLKGGDGDADDIATVTDADGHLVITHEKDITPLFATSDLEFVTEDQSFRVIFTKAADGSVTQAVVNNRDVWIKDK
jgi:hypothetical protein